jgi:SAM-dependent methyltransferase
MNENIYGAFARFYADEVYAQFSDAMLEYFPAAAERYNLPREGRLLDVACGNGAFAVGMAQRGWQVTGIDQSCDQLTIARERAGDLAIDWRQLDMRALDYQRSFDLVTCWFDSLNYMLTPEDLQAVFKGMYSALKPGGFAVFDMNTIHGIMVGWQRQKAYVQASTPTMLELHRNDCDWDRQIANLHITIFERGKKLPDGAYAWRRFDEIHTERAYPLYDLRAWLAGAGFSVVDILGSLQTFTPPRTDSARVWFTVRK